MEQKAKTLSFEGDDHRPLLQLRSLGQFDEKADLVSCIIPEQLLQLRIMDALTFIGQRGLCIIVI